MVNQTHDSQPDLLPGLSIIHANHLEDLRNVAVGWIKTHPLGVLETEQFIVQSNGMAQWLKLALAGDEGCGISAGLEIHLPGRWVWTAYRCVLGDDNIPVDSPYDRERLVWSLFSLLPLFSGESLFTPLNRFLENDGDQRRQYQLACHLADLYDQYQVYRADWLKEWARGNDWLVNARGKPVEMPLLQKWQPELWRRLKAHVPEGLQNIGRSDLHQDFLKQVEILDKRPPMLPPRVIVFGISSLPKQVLETLYAVSSICQVLLFVNNPCRHFWADIIEDRDLLAIENSRHHGKSSMPKNLDPLLIHQHANPLLAAWGKQGRDYIGLLYGYDAPETYKKNFAEIDLFRDFIPPETRGSLLQQIQQAILDLEPLVQTREDRQAVFQDDRSVVFQVAHSRQREVEILHDHLLHSFETLDNLKPRDIIVMTPDIDAYAPHIEAVFGNLSVQDPRFIPFTIADNPGKKSVPLLKAMDKLLHLPDLRMAAKDLMDLLEVPAFQRRFGFQDTDLPKLYQWIRGAGISWGLNKEQRTSFGLPPDLEQNTWEFGLKRMLLGYASGKSEAWNNIEPYDEIGGLEAHLVGLLAVIQERLEILWQELSTLCSPEQWCRCLRTLAKDFFEPVDSQDRLTLNRMDKVLDDWLNACSQAKLDQELNICVVRDFFLQKMLDQSTSQRFLTGMVNFGTLMPMRAIPFKVVCLLGMNDDAFPRSLPPLDFDLMAEKGLYRPGDRSKREDDRYLFLEALMSAREKFYLSHVGRDIRDNSHRMPSVLIGQFRDYIDAGWYLEGGFHPETSLDTEGENSLLDHLTIVHPLQPFGQAYFLNHCPKLFTYAHEWRSSLGVEACQTSRDILDMPCGEKNLSLGNLVGFMKKPVKYFFNHRLSIHFDDISVENQDQEPFALDLLAPFGLGTALLEAGLAAGLSLGSATMESGNPDPAAVEAAVIKEAERLTRTGELPMAGFGILAAQTLKEPVLAMLGLYRDFSAQWPTRCDPMEISLLLDPQGYPVAGVEDWLDNLHTRDLTDSFANLPRFARREFYPKEILDKSGKLKLTRLPALISLWIRHLAGCAMGMDLKSHLIAPDAVAAFEPMEKILAKDLLMAMVEIFWTGLTRPLPITAKTGLTYVSTIMAKDRDTAKKEASMTYEGNGYNFKGEVVYDIYLKRTFPEFEALWQAEDNRFSMLAVTLYEPLVSAVELL